MSLTQEDKERIAARVAEMAAAYRAKPTQELEDALGLRVATLPPDEREYVTTVLLQMVAAEETKKPRDGGAPKYRYGDSNPGFRTENPAS